MFKSLKRLIDSRLGRNIVLDDFANEYGYFIKVDHSYLYSVITFLRNDPDVRLTLLDQIISLPAEFSTFEEKEPDEKRLHLLYQLKSMKLPYRVTLAIEIDKTTDAIQSISSLFSGASWLEADLKAKHNVTIEETFER